MLRRQILKLTAGTAISALGFRVLAFDEKKALPKLDRAFAEASRAGRPLLVFVVAADPSLRYLDGVALGAFLNHGSDEDLAPLALTNIVCAPLAAIRAIAPHGTLGDDPLLVLLRPSVAAADCQVATFALEREQPENDPFSSNDGRTYEQILAQSADRIEKRSAKIAKFLWTELGPERVKELAALVRPKLGEAEVAQLDAPELAVAALSSARLRAGAAILLERVAGASGKDRAQVVTVLASEVRESIVKAPPAGAKWASSDGCGTKIEGEEDELRIACGMGFVPPLEQRFLMLLSDQDG